MRNVWKLATEAVANNAAAGARNRRAQWFMPSLRGRPECNNRSAGPAIPRVAASTAPRASSAWHRCPAFTGGPKRVLQFNVAGKLRGRLYVLVLVEVATAHLRHLAGKREIQGGPRATLGVENDAA